MVLLVLVVVVVLVIDPTDGPRMPHLLAAQSEMHLDYLFVESLDVATS